MPSKIKFSTYYLNDSWLEDNRNLLHLCTFSFFVFIWNINLFAISRVVTWEFLILFCELLLFVQVVHGRVYLVDSLMFGVRENMWFIICLIVTSGRSYYLIVDRKLIFFKFSTASVIIFNESHVWWCDVSWNSFPSTLLLVSGNIYWCIVREKPEDFLEFKSIWRVKM